MSKNLVFVKSIVRLQLENGTEEKAESWELLPFGDSPILHAAWNPVEGILIINFNSHKEDLKNVPETDEFGRIVRDKKGNPKFKERKMDTWFKSQITDKGAIQHILDTFVSNYDGQEWDIVYTPEQAQNIADVEKELQTAEVGEDTVE